MAEMGGCFGSPPIGDGGEGPNFYRDAERTRRPHLRLNVSLAGGQLFPIRGGPREHRHAPRVAIVPLTGSPENLYSANPLRGTARGRRSSHQVASGTAKKHALTDPGTYADRGTSHEYQSRLGVASSEGRKPHAPEGASNRESCDRRPSPTDYRDSLFGKDS